MSIRNLGDWSALDRDRDPIHADPEWISDAQRRYQGIATTIEDVVDKLRKIVGIGSDTLAGRSIEKLKSQAESLQGSLRKAGVRYHDVATQIAKYQPELDTALDETADALRKARVARDAQLAARALPEPQPAPDGTLPPGEQTKDSVKKRATGDADEDLRAAKDKLDAAMDALNRAGKHFGDMVNCNRYADDGLTDSGWDRFLDFMDRIGSKILAGLGILFTLLAIFIPGVNVIILGAAVVATLTLASDIALYAGGRGSLADVILSTVGFLLIGGAAIASMIGKGIARGARFARSQAAPPPRPVGDGVTQPFDWILDPGNEATRWVNLADWYNLPGINWLIGRFWPKLVPELGFLASAANQWKHAMGIWKAIRAGNWQEGLRDAFRLFGGLSGIRDLAAVAAGAVPPRQLSFAWYIWGTANAILQFLIGVIYTTLRIPKVIPDANPPGYGTA